MLFAFAFALYLSATCIAAVDVYFSGEDEARLIYGVVDVLFLGMTPMLGLVLNKTVFAIWRNDPHTKRLAHWRSMPIDAAAIVLARLAQFVALISVNATVFFILLYVLVPNLKHAYTPLQWAGVGAVWVCYGLIINVFYTWLELGEDGKRYVKFYIGFMLTMVLLAVLLARANVRVLGFVAERTQSTDYVWLLGGMALLAVAANVAGHCAVTRRIRRRAFTF